jgi:hypothetical protein
MKAAVLDMVLIWPRAIEISVDSHERRAFAAVAVFEPLAGCSNLVHSWHVSFGTENFFRLFSLRDFFEDCFHKKHHQIS